MCRVKQNWFVLHLSCSYRETDMLSQTVNSNDTKMLSAMLADSASSILSEGNHILCIYKYLLYL